MVQGNLDLLKKIVDESHYTVALCGSGMLEESGFLPIKSSERAYQIEKKYGVSPEYLFTSVYYNTRTDQFFDFYKNEMLDLSLQPSETSYALAAMERQGKLQSVITANIYEFSQRGGCKNVTNLHGSIFHNKCLRCGKEYPVEYVKNAKRVPLCEKCESVIRPMVSLFGEMIDSRLMTYTIEEIEKAEVLLLLGTTMESEVYGNYLKYFNGKNLVIIHKNWHHGDEKADLVFYDMPKDVIPKLGY